MDVLGRVSQLFRGTGPADPLYECQSCAAVYEVQYFVCPECQGFSVNRREWRLE